GFHRALASSLLVLMASKDLRVGSDAFCLITRILKSFGCDNLFFKFAKEQLCDLSQDPEMWLRVEVEAQEAALGQEDEENAGGHIGWTHRQQLAATRFHARLASENADASPSHKDDQAAEYGRSFKLEAVHTLRLSLVVVLAQRNPQLCDELVANGLTETLLMCLLDVAHPMRQAAALTELHRVQLLSPK
ncbi:unnamed protein product, partial [Polarella glacialis]